MEALFYTAMNYRQNSYIWRCSEQHRYPQTVDLLATWCLRPTADTCRASSESTLHYKHGLDYVFQNRPTVTNHSAAPLNKEYSPYVWTGGRLTLTHSETGPPGDRYMELEQRGMKRKIGRRGWERKRNVF